MTDAGHQSTFLVGLIGSAIQASLTPAMHECEADANGLRYVYRLIDLEKLGVGVDALPELLTAAERMGFAGVNVTHPCKQLVIPLLHELSDVARALGAVNTVLLSGGRRIGHNTDWWGFAESLRRGLPEVKRERVVQLGAGGAGAAVGYAALTLGVAQLTIVDTDWARAEGAAANLAGRFGQGRAFAARDIAAAVREADGLINATPVGMASYPGLPLAADLLRPDLWVADIVYFPLETELLRQARRLGCRTLDGGRMAVFQAAEAFRLFTGITPDAERMLRHFAVLTKG
ncbi:MAG: shikimate dehydrogenase [Alphaproteobacteria bacterium]|nr:shikimate dehydrogenase [Alphaproteobacteria bacterium]